MGSNRQKFTSENFKIIQQLYNTTKEIIFFGKRNILEHIILINQTKCMKHIFLKFFLNKSIKFVIELLMFCFLNKFFINLYFYIKIRS